MRTKGSSKQLQANRPNEKIHDAVFRELFKDEGRLKNLVKMLNGADAEVICAG